MWLACPTKHRVDYFELFLCIIFNEEIFFKVRRCMLSCYFPLRMHVGKYVYMSIEEWSSESHAA